MSEAAIEDILDHKSYNVGSAILCLWETGGRTDATVENLRKAAWYVSREIERLGGAESPEIKEPVPEKREQFRVPEKREQFRWATIRTGRWDYEAEISPDGIATYENRTGNQVQVGPEHYKVIKYR